MSRKRIKVGKNVVLRTNGVTLQAPPTLTLEQRLTGLEQYVYPNYDSIGELNPHTLWGRIELLYKYFRLVPLTDPGTPPKTTLVKE